MFKIGEFAKLTKVSIRMLRYYDETGLLKPAMVDSLTGYRFYSASQIPDLQKILLLRDMEFNVSEIAVILEKWKKESIIAFLENKKIEITKTIYLELQRIQKIDIAIQDIINQKIAIHYNVIIKKIPSCRILSFRKRIADYSYEKNLWETLYTFVKTEQISLLPGVNNLTIFHEEKSDRGIDIEIGVFVEKIGKNKNGFTYRETEPVEKMACIMVYGSYENIGASYHSFAHWMEKHQQYEIAGPIRQICHIGMFNEKNPENFLTEVQAPIRIKEKNLFPIDSNIM